MVERINDRCYELYPYELWDRDLMTYVFKIGYLFL